MLWWFLRLAKDHTGGVCGYFSRGMMQRVLLCTGVDKAHQLAALATAR